MTEAGRLEGIIDHATKQMIILIDNDRLHRSMVMSSIAQGCRSDHLRDLLENAYTDDVCVGDLPVWMAKAYHMGMSLIDWAVVVRHFEDKSVEEG